MAGESDAVTTARQVVAGHLRPGEQVRHVLMADVRTRQPPAQRFFGTRPRPRSGVVVTDRRLLVLRPGAKPGREDWLDLQLQRDRVAAEDPEMRGGALVVALSTGLGPRLLLLDPSAEAEALRVVDLLRSR